MTNNYLPLVLPSRGEELLEGRQYALTPLARLTMHEEFGLFNVPTIVECVKRRVARTTITSSTFNHETGETKVSIIDLPAQQATFKYGNLPHQRFTLDLSKLEERAPAYDKSHKLPRFEEDWFNTRCLPPSHIKFRGCSLRWWEGSMKEATGRGSPSSSRVREKIDLSVLD